MERLYDWQFFAYGLLRVRCGHGLWFSAMLVTALLLAGCSIDKTEAEYEAPEAARITQSTHWHGTQLNDPYQYLLDPDHPETTAYVADEKTWFERQTRQLKPLRAALARQLDAYLTTRLSSVPFREGDYEIFNQQGRGEQYPVFYRRNLISGQTSMLLDINQLAKGSDYFRLGGFATSLDGNQLAFTEDRNGDERYSLKVMDVESRFPLGLPVDGVDAGLAWSGQQVVYIDRTRRAVVSLSVETGAKTILFEEPDPAFSLSVSRAEAQWVRVTSESLDATEIRLIGPGGSMLLVKARQPGHRYRLQLRQGELTILSNFNGADYQLAVTKIVENAFENIQWMSGIDGQILDFERSGRAVAIHRRLGMNEFISVIDIESGKISDVALSDPGESLQLLPFDRWGNEVRFRREGFNHPSRSFGYSSQSGLLRSIDAAVVPSGTVPSGLTDSTLAPSGLAPSKLLPAGLDPADYQAELRWISVRDGVLVPVTIMYRKDQDMNGAPLLVTTYGAYGISVAFRFEPRRFPLLDRGFVLAHIHVRGGGELGEQWHNSGSRSNGMNSVTDFIDVTEQLVADGVGDRDSVYAEGASAGGAVIAAAINLKPGLFQAVILRAAFLDIINTLASEDQDLTFSDHLEWGNPKIPEQFAWLASLSPYENISTQPYPDLLLLAASNDRRVGLHESLKYLARVRHLNTGENLMLIDIDINSGHLGVSDQYKKRRQVTLEQSFLLRRLGSTQ